MERTGRRLKKLFRPEMAHKSDHMLKNSSINSIKHKRTNLKEKERNHMKAMIKRKSQKAKDNLDFILVMKPRTQHQLNLSLSSRINPRKEVKVFVNFR